MRFLYVAYALAVPSLANVVRDEKGYSGGIICPPCPSGHCCITGASCAPTPGLGQACTDSTEAPFPGVCPCFGDMKCVGGICVQN
ncbi:hypothetical protein ACQRIT_002017 [Beauveria bassiana]